jgi:hypothetical protein
MHLCTIVCFLGVTAIADEEDDEEGDKEGDDE